MKTSAILNLIITTAVVYLKMFLNKKVYRLLGLRVLSIYYVNGEKFRHANENPLLHGPNSVKQYSPLDLTSCPMVNDKRISRRRAQGKKSTRFLLGGFN